jgi:hypothetical protein
MIKKFPSENVKAKNTLGDLDAGKGLVLKLVLKRQVVKMRGASIYHRMFIIICPPVVGICRAMAESVVGVSTPRQGFDVRLASVRPVVHKVFWNGFMSEFFAFPKSV